MATAFSHVIAGFIVPLPLMVIVEEVLLLGALKMWTLGDID